MESIGYHNHSTIYIQPCGLRFWNATGSAQARQNLGVGWHSSQPSFDSYLNPISTKGADYVRPIGMSQPTFKSFRRDWLQCIKVLLCSVQCANLVLILWVCLWWYYLQHVYYLCIARKVRVRRNFALSTCIECQIIKKYISTKVILN